MPALLLIAIVVVGIPVLATWDLTVLFERWERRDA